MTTPSASEPANVQLKEHGVNTGTMIVPGFLVLWTLGRITSLLLLLLHSSEAASHLLLGNIPRAWAVGFNAVEPF